MPLSWKESVISRTGGASERVPEWSCGRETGRVTQGPFGPRGTVHSDDRGGRSMGTMSVAARWGKRAEGLG